MRDIGKFSQPSHHENSNEFVKPKVYIKSNKKLIALRFPIPQSGQL